MIQGEAVFADPPSNSPYIDKIKRKMKEKALKNGEDPSGASLDESYTEKLSRDLKAKDAEKGIVRPKETPSYSEQLKRKHPERFRKDEEASLDYTEKLKKELPPEKVESAIEAYKEGRSELKPRIEGEIHHAYGLRYGISTTHNAAGDGSSQAQNFQSIYGSSYSPDLNFFYEIQPIHSEWFGSVGLFGALGITYFSGIGKFSSTLERPGGGNFDAESGTKFQFFVVPATVGLNYRFNLFRIIRPYFMLGPSLIGYMERREDDGPSYWGNSRGYQIVAGAAILLDWISPRTSWDMYQNYGIKHSYLTIDYTRLSTLSGVNFSFYGFYMGFTFEY